MTEAERAKTIESLQLELFCLKRQLTVVKRTLILVKTRGTKVCRVCNKERSVKQMFFPDDRYRDGYYPYCRICKAARSRMNYEKKVKQAA